MVVVSMRRETTNSSFRYAMTLTFLILAIATNLGTVEATPFDNATDKNLSSVDVLIEHANDQSSPDGKHYYGDLMVFAIFAVVAGSSIGRFHGELAILQAIGLGSFISLIFAFMLNLMNLVDDIAVALPFALLIISGFIIKIKT